MPNIITTKSETNVTPCRCFLNQPKLPWFFKSSKLLISKSCLKYNSERFLSETDIKISKLVANFLARLRKQSCEIWLFDFLNECERCRDSKIIVRGRADTDYQHYSSYLDISLPDTPHILMRFCWPVQRSVESPIYI